MMKGCQEGTYLAVTFGRADQATPPVAERAAACVHFTFGGFIRTEPTGAYFSAWYS